MSDQRSRLHWQVSVIVPAWNAARTIEAAIRSVLAQSNGVAEVIICDDASEDETRSVALACADPRVKVLANATNLGPGPSRDRAIRIARSPWIALTDADDLWHADRVKSLLQAAESTRADVVFDDTLLCHDTGRGLIPWRPVHGRDAFGGSGPMPRLVDVEDYITSERLLIHPLIRGEFVLAHGIRHSARRFAEDAEFYLRLARAGARFCYVPDPLYYYRVSPGSLTAQANDPTMMRRCLEECAQWDGWWPSALAAFDSKIASLRVNEALYLLAHAIRNGELSQAARLIANEPRLLVTIPRRLVRQVQYQTHRLAHGGRRR